MAPQLSVVVVVYDMARELPRTLRTLAPSYQRGLDPADYEVVVVDNGSPAPIEPRLLESFEGRLWHERLDPAPPSPARAANIGLQRAEGELVGLIVDGARMASPGLLTWALRAAGLVPRPVVATLGWHLGPVRHMDAASSGYGQAVEDEMLSHVPWEEDGYALFGVTTLAGSSGRGWFGPLGESSALFLPRTCWEELGGLDEAFELPGGGLVNHDLYRRACELASTELIVLLGEGTFHQIHGGAATSRRFGREEMREEYRRLRGTAYRPPERLPTYLGTVPPECLEHVGESVRLAIARRDR